jgi:hypothetical protein
MQLAFEVIKREEGLLELHICKVEVLLIVHGLGLKCLYLLLSLLIFILHKLNVHEKSLILNLQVSHLTPLISFSRRNL